MEYEVITRQFLQENSLVKQFIDSYNKFVDEGLQQIVNDQATIEPQVENLVLKLGKITIGQPSVTEADGSRRTLYPMEARLRDLNYSAPLFLEITPYFSGAPGRTETVFIGELPVMTKSKLCYLSKMNRQELIAAGEDSMDPGAYFVINGTEKALMSIEDLAPNRIFVSKEPGGLVQAKVFSTRLGFRGRITVDRSKDGKLTVSIPSFNKSIELVVLLRALGLIDKQKLFAAFAEMPEIENDLTLNFEPEADIKTKRDALEAIGKRAAPGQPVDYQLKRAELLIDRYLLPHIGVDEKDRMAKAYYLCRMAERSILAAYKKRAAEDKDHYANKRLKISGKLMEELFRYAFQFFVKDVAYQLERANIRRRKMTLFTIVRPDALTERMKYSMATGNWMGGHTGVCQPLDRYNFVSAIAFSRRVISPLAKKHPHHKARDLHGTHFGRLDPNETPEGPNCVVPETQVLTGNETATTIGEYEKLLGTEKLMSSNWEDGKKLTESSIGRYIKYDSREYDALKVTTETGRTIIATPDHPFYSPDGKTVLKNLQAGSRVAVLPGNPLQLEAQKEETILNEEQLKAALPPKSDYEYTRLALQARKLLPLKTTDKRAAILARLLGHLFGDGCLSYSMKKHKSNCSITFTGTAEDLGEIKADIQKLGGFNVSKTTKQHTRSTLVSGQVIEGDTTRCTSYSKPLFALLAALGAPVGEKTGMKTSVPEWIANGGMLFQKEFLSAYFGSEMTRPRMQKGGRNFTSPAFSLNKTDEMFPQGMAFAQQVEKMLARFGVEIAYTNVIDGVQRRDGKKTKKIKAIFSTKPQSLAALYGTISFTYCKSRKALARFSTEYIQLKDALLSRRSEVQKQAIALLASGKAASTVAVEMSLPLHTVADWKRSYAKLGGKAGAHVPASMIPSFDEFIAQNAASEEGMCWETIEKIEAVKVPDVRDVTTIENTHNFFANGFLTGNCGLIKSLALFCDVTSGADETHVEKALKQLGVTMQVL